MQGFEHIPNSETKALVAARKARGCTDVQIAASLDISFETLTKHYPLELRTGKDVFADKVFGKLAEKIFEGSEKSIHFYLTHQMKWSSGDKDKEIDALAEQAKALQYKDEVEAAKAAIRERTEE